ncbi:MAG TPA: RHS repeat-associated core domain-containing protein, partial [Flavobacterium sp.]|nr:RHS repeat-associated core domain-containing protein [Flavobacterium sp.]
MGNLAEDKNKGITSIAYNHLNLPVKVVFGSESNRIEYLYAADGRKLKKLVPYVNGNVQGGYAFTAMDYLDGFHYQDGSLKYFPTAEGYVQKTLSMYSYVYNYTDHLGNVRMSYAEDPENPGTLKVIEESHYYPFGLKHTRYNSTELEFAGRQGSVVLRAAAAPANPAPVLGYSYKFSGKELQGELGMNVYDFGFRNYDPTIGRWFNIDPLAELASNKTPYHFVSNNPISRIDLLGLTDYTLNRKTGEITQIGEADDNPDRILKTNSKGEVRYNRKGEAIVEIDGIARGILRDGMNFKTNDNLIKVGERGQPTVSQVELFVLKLSAYIGKEISGAYFSKNGSINDTYMSIGQYKDNTYTKSLSKGTNLRAYFDEIEEIKKIRITGFYHTHPDGAGIDDSDRLVPSDQDLKVRD